MAWLGQKSDPEPIRPISPTPTPTPSPSAAVTPQPAYRPIVSESVEKIESAKVASIGKSLHFKGELTGNEDLVIEGKVEGSITLNGYKVTIGPTGHVVADIQAKSVVVGGQVNGSIRADDRAEVTATGTMLGDVRAPRVVLADGARFKGRVEMDTKSVPAAVVATPSASRVMSTPALSEDDSRVYASAAKS
jgi:Integral membrane protein CcmA involved in cell shape determination